MWKNISKVGNFNVLPLEYNTNTSSYEISITDLMKYKGNIFTIPQFNYVEFNKNIIGYGFEEYMDNKSYRCKLYQEYIEYNIDKKNLSTDFLWDEFLNKCIRTNSFIVISDGNKKIKNIILSTASYNMTIPYTLVFNDEFYYTITIPPKQSQTIDLNSINPNYDYQYFIIGTNHESTPTLYVTLTYSDSTTKTFQSNVGYSDTSNSKFYDMYKLKKIMNFGNSNYYTDNLNSVDKNFVMFVFPLDIANEYTSLYMESDMSRVYVSDSTRNYYNKYKHNTNFITVSIPFDYDNILYKKDVLNTVINDYNYKYFDKVLLDICIHNESYIKKYNKKYFILNIYSIVQLFEENGPWSETDRMNLDITVSVGYTYNKKKEYIDVANLSTSILEVL